MHAIHFALLASIFLTNFSTYASTKTTTKAQLVALQDDITLFENALSLSSYDQKYNIIPKDQVLDLLNKIANTQELSEQDKADSWHVPVYSPDTPPTTFVRLGVIRNILDKSAPFHSYRLTHHKNPEPFTCSTRALEIAHKHLMTNLYILCDLTAYNNEKWTPTSVVLIGTTAPEQKEQFHKLFESQKDTLRTCKRTVDDINQNIRAKKQQQAFLRTLVAPLQLDPSSLDIAETHKLVEKVGCNSLSDADANQASKIPLYCKTEDSFDPFGSLGDLTKDQWRNFRTLSGTSYYITAKSYKSMRKKLQEDQYQICVYKGKAIVLADSTNPEDVEELFSEIDRIQLELAKLDAEEQQDQLDVARSQQAHAH